MSDLFPPDTSAGPYERAGRVAPKTVVRRDVDHFDYADERGNLLFQVVRTEPKGFYQRTPDAKCKDGWYPGLGGVRRVLFRLPRLVDPSLASQPVIWAEGERLVLLLESWGLLATCNVGGAGMGWRDDYSRALTGRRVLVLPDNDEAGRRLADAIVGSLVRHGAAGVRLLALPGLPEGGDVLDYAAAGGDRKGLIELARAAPEYRAG